MKNYQQFYSTLLLESILHVEPNFAEIIKSLANVDNVAKELSKLFDQDIEINNNYLQLGDAEDLVYFIPDSQAQKAADPWGKKNSAKIGRLVNQLLTSQKINVSSSEIEKFVNRYKTAWKEFKLQGSDKEPIKLVQGDEIKKWYNGENYYDKDEEGTLGNSCMRYKSCQGFFKIYVNNPEVCQLAILLNDDDLLLGRALVWKLTNGRHYIDRIYTRWDSDVELMHNFLKKKYPDSWSYQNDDNDDEELEVQLKDNFVEYFNRPEGDVDYRFPYMDSLYYLNVETGILNNSEDEGIFQIKLHETDGDFSNYSSFRWSNQQGKIIDTSNLVEVIINGERDWVNKSETATDFNGRRCLKSDLVFSDLYQGLIGNPEKTKWGIAPKDDIYIIDGERVPGVFDMGRNNDRYVKFRKENQDKSLPYFIYSRHDYRFIKDLHQSIDQSRDPYLSDGIKMLALETKKLTRTLSVTNYSDCKYYTYFSGIYPVGISKIVYFSHDDEEMGEMCWTIQSWLDLLPELSLTILEQSDEVYVGTDQQFHAQILRGNSLITWDFINYANQLLKEEKIEDYYSLLRKLTIPLTPAILEHIKKAFQKSAAQILSSERVKRIFEEDIDDNDTKPNITISDFQTPEFLKVFTQVLFNYYYDIDEEVEGVYKYYSHRRKLRVGDAIYIAEYDLPNQLEIESDLIVKAINANDAYKKSEAIEKINF